MKTARQRDLYRAGTFTLDQLRKRATLSETKRRKRNDDICGLVIIGLCILGLSAMFYGAYKADQANGISISQSLKNNGF